MMKKVFIGIMCFIILALGSGYANANLDPIAVPEPSTLILLGSGLIAIVAFRKRSRKS